MENIFDYIKSKKDKKVDDNIYIDSYAYRMRMYNLLNILFNWKTPEGFKMLKKAELFLHINGSFGYDLKNKKWVIGRFNTILDDDGDYTEYVCHTLSTTDKQCYVLKNHEEVVVCGNNLLYSTDNTFIRYFADTLQETDISIYHQLMNSRNIPALTGIDDNERKEVVNLFAQRKAGCPVTISTDLLNDVKTLDICDNTALDRLSTLDNFHEELIKRFCNGFGIDVETKEKKAQVNSMELDSFGDYSTLYFLAMFQAREDFCKEMQENGIDIEVVRNPIFWDEPTEEDIEEGEFELMEEKGEENVGQEDGETERDSEGEETGTSATNDESDSSK